MISNNYNLQELLDLKKYILNLILPSSIWERILKYIPIFNNIKDLNEYVLCYNCQKFTYGRYLTSCENCLNKVCKGCLRPYFDTNVCGSCRINPKFTLNYRF